MAYEFGIAPSQVLAETDRMIFTMTRYLSYRAKQMGGN